MGWHLILWIQPVAFLMFSFALPVPAIAQGATTSAIVGSVIDLSGGAIPGATVTITSVENGLKRSIKTDDSGRFSFPQLKPGTYLVKVEADRFETQQNSSVSAGLGQSKRSISSSTSHPQARASWCRNKAADQRGKSQYLDDPESNYGWRCTQPEPITSMFPGWSVLLKLYVVRAAGCPPRLLRLEIDRTDSRYSGDDGFPCERFSAGKSLNRSVIEIRRDRETVSGAIKREPVPALTG
jgi:hypothetical protein